jgi:hypothetical protein
MGGRMKAKMTTRGDTLFFIRKAFKEYFLPRCIELPATIPQKGKIEEAGWSINYILMKDKGGNSYLDFSADHRMTNHRHHRIQSNGKIVELDSFDDFISYNPKKKGDKERADREFYKHNAKVANILRKKGLIG